jgi:hypothetical protein
MDSGVAKEIQDHTNIETADSQGFGKADIDEILHGFLCFLNGGVGCLDV